MPRAGDVEGLVAAEGSEYLLGDDVTLETDVETGLALQHVEASSMQQQNQLSILLTNVYKPQTLLQITVKPSNLLALHFHGFEININSKHCQLFNNTLTSEQTFSRQTHTYMPEYSEIACLHCSSHLLLEDVQTKV